MSPLEGSASELAAAVVGGRVAPGAMARLSLGAIQRWDSGPDRLNAFITYSADRVAASAASLEGSLRDGRSRPLAGVPVAVKDNICTLEFPTTCGSRILGEYWSAFEATAVRRLREAGALIVGKTNMDEFAMGSSTENSAFGPTRNPLDPTRVPGGSSGGSAAAVAAGIVPLALGSETGGSVRQPAAFCGVVGIKPSYGRVSRYGLVAFASSLDHIGTLGRSVADAALLLDVIGGPDSLDSTSSQQRLVSAALDLDRGMQGMVVGVPREYFPPELDERIADACRAAIERMAAAGAQIREISLPHTRYAIPTYYLIATAEASSNLARYDGVRYGLRAPDANVTRAVYDATRELGFGAEVKRRIMLGTYALSAGYYDQYYGRAQRVRALIAGDFRRVFDSGVDVIFTPTTPTVAFRLGEKTADPYAMYLADVFTVTANLAAIPAMSIPIGMAGGLPVGGQFLADRWHDHTMIRAAAALERALQEQGRV
jgi:aspartyl-tRNA(Asn)/glutamyl-tRNA(Gln) amidotransferase subunit A